MDLDSLPKRPSTENLLSQMVPYIATNCYSKPEYLILESFGLLGSGARK